MLADTIFKTEEKSEVDKITELIKSASEEQQDTMRFVIQCINLGIAIGKGEAALCDQDKSSDLETYIEDYTIMKMKGIEETA